MGSAHKRGRGEEPFEVGQRVGVQGCLWCGGVHLGSAQLSARSFCDRQAGRKRPRPPQDAKSGRQQLPGKGGASGSCGPRLPYRRWLQGTGTPRSRRTQVYVRPLIQPRAPHSGNPRVAGAPMPGKIPCCLPSPPPTRSENPLNRRRNPDRPVVPASSLPPPPRAAAASRPTPSSAFTTRGTLISMTTWDDSLQGGGEVGDTRSHPPPAPSRWPPRGDSALGAPLALVLLPINCLGGGGWGGEGTWPPPPPGGRSAAGRAVRSLRGGVHQHHPCVQV